MFAVQLRELRDRRTLLSALRQSVRGQRRRQLFGAGQRAQRRRRIFCSCDPRGCERARAPKACNWQVFRRAKTTPRSSEFLRSARSMSVAFACLALLAAPAERERRPTTASTGEPQPSHAAAAAILRFLAAAACSIGLKAARFPLSCRRRATARNPATALLARWPDGRFETRARRSQQRQHNSAAATASRTRNSTIFSPASTRPPPTATIANVTSDAASSSFPTISIMVNFKFVASRRAVDSIRASELASNTKHNRRLAAGERRLHARRQTAIVAGAKSSPNKNRPAARDDGLVVVRRDAASGRHFNCSRVFRFYSTPQPPKPAMHDIVIGNWHAGERNAAAGYSGAIFGPTSLIINNVSRPRSARASIFSHRSAMAKTRLPSAQAAAAKTDEFAPSSGSRDSSVCRPATIEACRAKVGGAETSLQSTVACRHAGAFRVSQPSSQLPAKVCIASRLASSRLCTCSWSATWKAGAKCECAPAGYSGAFINSR